MYRNYSIYFILIAIFKDMRIQGVIAAQCFLIFTFLNYYVKASDETSVEFDLPPTTARTFVQVGVGQFIKGEDDVDDDEVDNDNKDDLCQLLPKKGFCKRYERRYYYDVKEERCKSFIYGGCFGNKNNFKTYTECSRLCGGKTQICPSVRPKRPKFCYRKQKRGPCKVNLPRYYFNWKTNNCEIFIYGGCRGNKNNFYRLTECEDVCKAANDKL